MPKIIKVDDDFERLLKESWKRFNEKLKKKTGKTITFIDFTNLISDSFGGNLDLLLSRAIIMPIRKGRKRAKAKREDLKNVLFPW